MVDGRVRELDCHSERLGPHRCPAHASYITELSFSRRTCRSAALFSATRKHSSGRGATGSRRRGYSQALKVGLLPFTHARQRRAQTPHGTRGEVMEGQRRAAVGELRQQSPTGLSGAVVSGQCQYVTDIYEEHYRTDKPIGK